MNTRSLALSMSLILAFLLAACGPQASVSEVMLEKDLESEAVMSEKDQDMDSKSPGTDDSMSVDSMSDHNDAKMEEGDQALDNEDDGMMSEDDGTVSDKDESMMEKDAETDMGAMELPSWFMTDLVDASTGNVFQVADFKGKVILVETLAMWCSNCLKQQVQVKELHDLLGDRDDFVSLGIDIDPNEDLDTLKGYIMTNGFDWLYTVAPVEVSREIGQIYSNQYLNPPSTPMLIIDREGVAHLLPFGIKDAAELYDALQPFLGGEM